MSFYDFHNYINENSIFLRDDLKKEFLAIDKAIWGTIVHKEVAQEAKDRKMQRESYSKVEEEIEPIRVKIENLVQKRLQLETTL